jgi:hypothetical protein
MKPILNLYANKRQAQQAFEKWLPNEGDFT